MQRAQSRTLSLCAEGPFALFTSPAFKVEKVSYDVMTVPAARGIVQAICWKPAVDIDVHSIEVCRPIRRATMTVNGVSEKMHVPSREHLLGKADPDDLVQNVSSNRLRLQARHVLLLDVRYVIHFRYYMTDQAEGGDNPYKFENMFSKRLKKGQHFRLPHFGLQQHVASCRPVRDDDLPLDDTRDLGMMPHHRVYGDTSVETEWFHAKLERGVIGVPPLEEVPR